MRTDILRNTALAALLLAAPLALTACDNKGPAERAGEKIDDAAEKAGEKLEDARDKAGEAVDDLRDKADAAMEKVEEKK
ncbi:hypothetical protein [Niveispirillum sp. KHB5.9]|uniref:hypothetical protein n=1 Tax=Niveispirillum sp. KHB5.9 TaxID=3400269 RepID=UPI003A8B1E26